MKKRLLALFLSMALLCALTVPAAAQSADDRLAAVTAKVKVNGASVGGVCFAPFQLDVTKAVKAGENTLEVEVCNLWINRLVGDEGLADRPTWTSLPCVDKNTALPTSGLVGPVRLVQEAPAR